MAIVGRNVEKGEKVAQEYGCRFFTSLKAAKDEVGVDIVDICVPTDLHEQFVKEAAALKCHVLCEKPITFTVESFDRMVEACRGNGVRFMVAQVARWWPEFMVMKDYIEAGKLGKHPHDL